MVTRRMVREERKRGYRIEKEERYGGNKRRIEKEEDVEEIGGEIE